ncbi:MAG: hypothetical protein ACLTLQ_02265 [[Clostridium] scindens]
MGQYARQRSYSALVPGGDSSALFFCGSADPVLGIAFRIYRHVAIVMKDRPSCSIAEWAKPIYFFSVFMMLLVKTPLGKEVNGAKRWIKSFHLTRQQ